MKNIFVNRFIQALLKHKVPLSMLRKLPSDFKRCIVISAANDLLKKDFKGVDLKSMLRCNSLDSEQLRSFIKDYKAEDVWSPELIKSVKEELSCSNPNCFNVVNKMVEATPNYLQYGERIEASDISHLLPS